MLLIGCWGVCLVVDLGTKEEWDALARGVNKFDPIDWVRVSEYNVVCRQRDDAERRVKGLADELYASRVREDRLQVELDRLRGVSS